MPTQINDSIRKPGDDLPDGLRPAQPLDKSWQAKAHRYLEGRGWVALRLAPDGTGLMWEDPLAEDPRAGGTPLTIYLPNGEGGQWPIKQVALPPSGILCGTVDALLVQHGRTRAHGGGVKGDLAACEANLAALKRDIAWFEKRRAREEADPPPAAVPTPAAPKPPPPEMLPTRDLPAGAVHTISLWPPWPGAFSRMTLALVEAAAVPQLVAKLGLGEAELFVPAEGAANGKPCVVLGECKVVTQTPMVYGCEDAYPLPEVGRLTRVFSKPRQEADIAALKKAAAEAARADKLAEENRRLEENRRREEARLEAQRRASPMYRIRELEKKLGEALGEQPPPST
jgi:hypothetical protein